MAVVISADGINPNRGERTCCMDRLAEIDNIMMRYALAYSPLEKDEKGEPCRPYWGRRDAAAGITH